MIRKPVLPIAHWPLRRPVSQKSLLVHTYTQTDPITEHSSLQAWWIWIYCIQYDFKHSEPQQMCQSKYQKSACVGVYIGFTFEKQVHYNDNVGKTDIFITWASNKSTQFYPRCQSFSVNLLPCYFSLFRCCT